MTLDKVTVTNTYKHTHTHTHKQVTSSMINKRVAEAEETNANIATAREGYRIVATRGSLLYFVIADLPQVKMHVVGYIYVQICMCRLCTYRYLLI
jgi:hypothetical protein